MNDEGIDPSPMRVWRIERNVPALGTAEAHVWRASVSAFAPRMCEVQRVLGQDELARGTRFHHQIDRQRYFVAHALVRLLLADYLKRDPAALRFDIGASGKPHVADSAGVRFNLSHSGDLVLIAVSLGEVGVDVERWTPGIALEELEALATTAFSPAERALVRDTPAEKRTAAFYRIWTRKEAYLKGTGAGVTQGLDHFDVTIASEDSCLLVDRRDPAASTSWLLRDLELAPGYSGALLVERARSTVAQLIASPALLARVP